MSGCSISKLRIATTCTGTTLSSHCLGHSYASVPSHYNRHLGKSISTAISTTVHGNPNHLLPTRHTSLLSMHHCTDSPGT